MSSSETKANVAVCIAGELRTFFEDDVFSGFRNAVINPLQPALFFQVTLVDHNRLSDWHHYPTSVFKPLPTHDEALSRIQTLRPVHLHIASDEELTLHPLWRGEHGIMPHWAFRWALCARAIESEERARGMQYDWIVRMRPDMTWHCSLPSLLSAWPAEDIIFQQDWLAIARRSFANTILRVYPFGWGFVACTRNSGEVWPEFCVYYLALRDGAITRWSTSLIHLRRPCDWKTEFHNASHQLCVPPVIGSSLPLNACNLHDTMNATGFNLSGTTLSLFPKLAADERIAFSPVEAHATLLR